MDWSARSKVVIGAVAGIVAASGVAIVLTAGSGVTTPAAFADSGAATKGITTDGNGKVYGTPDTLNLSMGVQVTKPDVSTAFDTANHDLDKVIESLQAHGVEKKDIQTSGLSINPQYGGGNHPVITGYQVSNSLNVVIHGLSKAGKTVSAAVQAGGNDVTVNGLSVSLDDDPALLKAARESAYNDAKQKAEQYAELAGKSLGKPLSITESVQGQSTPMPYAFGSSGSTAGTADLAETPVQAGEQAVTVAVTIVWDFS
jgi:uncharacterized protein YggE